MGKRKIPENTPYFNYWQVNPKNKLCGDCVIRAISTALEQSWEETMREMTEVGIKLGLPFNETKTIDKYLIERGWIRHKQPRHSDNSKIRGIEFCAEMQEKEIASYMNVIASIGSHHITCIINGKIHDTWNCSNNCIGVYWTQCDFEVCNF